MRTRDLQSNDLDVKPAFVICETPLANRCLRCFESNYCGIVCPVAAPACLYEPFYTYDIFVLGALVRL